MTGAAWLDAFQLGAKRRVSSVPAYCASSRRAAQRLSFTSLLLLSLSVGLSYLLKRHYSQANVEELTWILAPTAELTELLSGREFSFEAGVGYLSQEALIAITKACAGVNFLIIAGALLSLLWLTEYRSFARQAVTFCLVWSVSAVATLVVNSSRILMAIALHGPHRTEGTALYFGALLLLGAVAANCRPLQEGRRSGSSEQPSGFVPTVSRTTAVITLASLVYLTGTLLVPWLNGAAEKTPGAFREYSQTVLSVTLGGASLVWLLSRQLRTLPSGGTCADSIAPP